MKKLYTACLAVLLLAAGCKKDLPTATLHNPASLGGFTVSANSVVLSPANDSAEVAIFKWPALSYGASVPVTYTLLIDQPSDTGGTKGWSSALSTTVSTDSLNKSWLGTDFNRLVNQLGLTPGVASPVVIRLRADVNQSNGSASTVAPLYSDLGMTVTPYKVIIVYPKLYVAGDFLVPNWTQKDQPGWILASVKSNSIYEGYVNFPTASNNFKLCTQLDWNGTNYGWGNSQTTISGSGSAGNCWFGQVAYTRVVADVSALTITYTPTSWTIAGDFNSWSTTANPMTFDPNTNVWTASGITLTAGTGFKFVGDPGWATNFGVDAKGNLSYGAGNIPVTKSGTFTVTLDLSQGAGNYAWSLK
jgi:hypothetical protein